MSLLNCNNYIPLSGFINLIHENAGRAEERGKKYAFALTNYYVFRCYYLRLKSFLRLQLENSLECPLCCVCAVLSSLLLFPLFSGALDLNCAIRAFVVCELKDSDMRFGAIVQLN